MDENNNNNSNIDASKLIADGAKMLWRKVPITVKLWIIGGAAVVLFLIIIIAAFSGGSSYQVGDYANEVTASGSVEEDFEEFWTELCDEGEEGCTEEDIARDKEIKESQQKFFDKLKSLSTKYSLSSKQRYMVLTTAFFGYQIDEFSEDNSAYELDENDEINYDTATTSSENVYDREKDSLKELVKQFKVYTAVCTTTYKNENGEDVTESYSPKTPDNKYYNFNFFEYSLYNIGIKPSDEGFAEAKSICVNEGGKFTIEKTEASTASEENFYDYLEESDYFDSKDSLSSYFGDYAKRKGIVETDLSKWDTTDLVEVRKKIIEDIKDIVQEYTEQTSDGFIAAGTSLSYWWPIGSDTTTEVDGVTFASDAPAYTQINSPFGYRKSPGGVGSTNHLGVDLNGAMGTTNIIASLAGEVVSVNDTCASSGSNGCGGGYGNNVQILDTKGNINIYAHMYLNSVTVKVGDTVAQGQVLGKVGSSGNSTGAHLHFTIKIGGVAVDPMDYISADNPRPTGSANVEFNTSSFTKEEFASKVTAYYSDNGCAGNSRCLTYYKSDILAHVGEIYDIGVSHNINPELIIARAVLEGYSPAVGHNYYGYGVGNGESSGKSFSSINAAAEAFFNNASQYTSTYDMMYKYAYIGSYWYTVNASNGGWGLGGCIYANYIYPDGLPERVKEACSKPEGTCTKNSTSACTPTTEDDQAAYTNYQVQRISDVISNIFG